MNHDAEDDEDVPSGSVEPGSFDRAITYRHVPMEHMMNIIDNAHYCEQTVHYTCNSAKLLNSPGKICLLSFSIILCLSPLSRPLVPLNDFGHQRHAPNLVHHTRTLCLA